MLAEPVATCIHAFRLSPLALPGTVVVLGAGTIGTLACVVARLLGAMRVFVSEPNDERRAWAQPIADAAVRPEELADTLLAAPRASGAALVVDAVGSDATRAASIALLQPGGCALWLGMHDEEATIPAFDLVVREQSIRGSFAYTDADFACCRGRARPASRSVSPPDENMLARGRSRRVRGARGGGNGRIRQSVVDADREATMRFDLLIRGGEVVDPGGGKEGRLDVAIERDRIAAVDKDISPESAFHVVDAGGQIVTPGLVDLHTHVFHKITYWGIDPDPVASRTGVTTWNDAGSAGALTLPGLRDFVVRPAQVGITAFLNISSIGLVCDDYECANSHYLDVELFRRLADRNRDLVRGVKVRMGNVPHIRG